MDLDLSSILLTIEGVPITLDWVFAGFVALILGPLLWVATASSHMRKRTAEIEARARAEKDALTEKLSSMATAQTELTGRVQSMTEMLGSRQSELARVMGERMDGLGHRIGQSMSQSQNQTHQTLRTLHERLAAIDSAQKNITELSQGVVELQSILADKQTRGAFGQGRMEAIVQDALPRGAYSFQHTLSNSKRPDCVVFLPNDAPSLVIDAKFPLEAWNALRDAPDERLATEAARRVRQDVGKHVQDIAAKYFIPGETHETAFMFVPSESVFADLHERFEDVVQKAARQRVVIVSPSLLTLSIQVVQAVLRDARLREQAHLIQDEVGRLVEDIGRLDDRVAKLSNHFGQAQRDIEQIQTSTGKITKRGARIGDLDVGQPTHAVEPKHDDEPRQLPLAGE
ncbi:MAG: DNA recombination protein RmuC [Pseudomonadota bacterium]